MVRLAAERRKMSKMIKDTLMLLVKNGLTFSDRFTIEALIGITVDEGDVMLVSMNELIQSDTLKDKNETNQDSHSSKKQSKSRRDKHKKRAVVETEEIVSSENEDYELIVKAEQSPKKRSRVERSEVTRPSEGVTPKASHMSLTLVPPDESLEGKPKQIDNGDKDDDSYTNNDVIIKSEVSEVDVEWPDFPLDDTSHPGTSDGDQPIFSSNLLDSGGQGDSQPGTSQQTAKCSRPLDLNGHDGECDVYGLRTMDVILPPTVIPDRAWIPPQHHIVPHPQHIALPPQHIVSPMRMFVPLEHGFPQLSSTFLHNKRHNRTNKQVQPLDKCTLLASKRICHMCGKDFGDTSQNSLKRHLTLCRLLNL